MWCSFPTLQDERNEKFSGCCVWWVVTVKVLLKNKVKELMFIRETNRYLFCREENEYKSLQLSERK